MSDGFLKPEEAIEAWDVRPGEKVVDFGCGAGFFSIPLGQRVGANGKVYAIDIRTEALEATRAKVKLFHLFNVEPMRADLEAPKGSGIKDNSVDKVLIANILFQAENKKMLAGEAFRILRPGGSAMIVEWSDASAAFADGSAAGPFLGHRVGREEAKNFFISAGLSFFKEFSAGSQHYGLIFKK